MVRSISPQGILFLTFRKSVPMNAARLDELGTFIESIRLNAPRYTCFITMAVSTSRENYFDSPHIVWWFFVVAFLALVTVGNISMV